MVVPKKIIKIEERKKLQDTLIKLTTMWYTLGEISENINMHRNTLSWIINKWEEFPISLEKINKLNIVIEKTFFNS